jgi:hypothetical protein
MNEDETKVANATTPLKEGVVHQTRDYGQFHYIDSNRTINKNHVQHLIQSFENNPALVQTRPILVNENLEVIDGQHRLQACSTLRIPVYYMIASGTNVESAQLMNALQRGWSLVDFARSYALNREDPVRANTYKQFLSLFEEYQVPISLLVSFCEQRSRHNATAGFKKGDFEIKDIEVTRAWLNMMEEIYELINPDVIKHNRYAFTHALFNLFKNADYNHERMLKKLREKQLEPQMDRIAYLRALEAIYNHNLKDDTNRVRFF